MKNKFLLTSIPALLLLSACSAAPSAEGVETAVAGTQAALPSQTPYPTYTAPPPTPFPTKIQFFESFSIRFVPGTANSLFYDSDTGTEIELRFPANFQQVLSRVALLPGLNEQVPPAFVYGGDAFTLLGAHGDRMEDFKAFVFDAPVSAIITLAGELPGSSPDLYKWTGSEYVRSESECPNGESSAYDEATRTVRTYLCAPGSFAVMAPPEE